MMNMWLLTSCSEFMMLAFSGVNRSRMAYRKPRSSFRSISWINTLKYLRQTRHSHQCLAAKLRRPENGGQIVAKIKRHFKHDCFSGQLDCRGQIRIRTEVWLLNTEGRKNLFTQQKYSTAHQTERKSHSLDARNVRVPCCSGDNADISERFGFCRNFQKRPY